MVKYVKKACIGMTTGPSILLDWIEKDYKSYVEAFFTSRLSDPTLSANKQKEIKKAKSYLLGHWKAIQRQKDKNYIGCSAEEHVSHVLSSRLSSRPIGWSKTGANNIAKIRVFFEK
ncbi:hypothetical protein EPB68_14230 [Enterococcus faecalis]|nr:hypothetical protein EPB68_14230 [Enterococcus faecalis]